VRKLGKSVRKRRNSARKKGNQISLGFNNKAWLIKRNLGKILGTSKEVIVNYFF
jgi:hypothetical protein